MRTRGAAQTTFIPRDTDVFISTWNLHRSPALWEHLDVYDSVRFLRNSSNPAQSGWAGYTAGSGKQMYPNEVHADFAFLLFEGGSRKCMCDQLVMMESITTVALIP